MGIRTVTHNGNKRGFKFARTGLEAVGAPAVSIVGLVEQNNIRHLYYSYVHQSLATLLSLVVER